MVFGFPYLEFFSNKIMGNCQYKVIMGTSMQLVGSAFSTVRLTISPIPTSTQLFFRPD